MEYASNVALASAIAPGHNIEPTQCATQCGSGPTGLIAHVPVPSSIYLVVIGVAALAKFRGRK